LISIDDAATDTVNTNGPEPDAEAARATIPNDRLLGATEAEGRERWALTYAVDGDLRFISHHDTLRLFQRALARADLPVRFSKGFNPHASVSVVLPRPVGVASDVDVVVIEFERRLGERDAIAKLSAQMPRGLSLGSARRLERGEKLHPSLARYRLDASGLLPIDVDQRILAILESASLPMERKHAKTGQTRVIDARPYIEDIQRCDSAIEFALRITETGTVRPAEMVALLGMNAQAGVARIRRIEIHWRNTSGRTNKSHDGRKERTQEDPEEEDRQG